MKALYALCLLALAAALCAPSGHAQTQIELGPRVGFEVSDIEELFVGADARISTASLPVQINPTFDYYFVDGDVTFIQLTGNALYAFDIDNQAFTPYAGGGVSYIRASVSGFSNSDVGLNLLGGAKFGVSNLQLFAQGEFVLGDADPAKLTAGVLFILGGE